MERPLSTPRTHVEMGKRAAEQNPDCVSAVAGPTAITYGISRMWQALVDQTEIRIGVFRTVNEAEGWLAKELAS